ncbi:hypothetical protein D3C81_2335040 [compost metagenome]
MIFDKSSYTIVELLLFGRKLYVDIFYDPFSKIKLPVAAAVTNHDFGEFILELIFILGNSFIYDKIG